MIKQSTKLLTKVFLIFVLFFSISIDINGGRSLFVTNCFCAEDQLMFKIEDPAPSDDKLMFKIEEPEEDKLMFAIEEEKKQMFSVQVGAFLKESYAHTLVKKLEAKGYKPYIHIEIDIKKKKWYTVRIGDYATVKECELVVASLKKKDNIQAVITRKDSIVFEHITPEPEKKIAVKKPVKKIIPPKKPKKKVDKKKIDKKKPEVEEEEVLVKEEEEELLTIPNPSEDDEQAKKLEDDMTEEFAMDTEEKGQEAENEEVSATSEEMEDMRIQMKTLQEEVTALRRESDVRKKLTITEEEQSKKEEEILSSTGRDYTLMKQGSLSLDYSLRYTYNSLDLLAQANTVEHRSNHSLANNIGVSFAVLDNITVNSSIPFMYKYDALGQGESKNVTDIGDVSFGLSWQPMKVGGDLPSVTFNTNYSFPLGRSPYEIDINEDLATGSGTPSVNAGVSFSKAVDPVIAFGGLTYTHAFDVKDLDQQRAGGRILEKVMPGDSIGMNMGLGYALSYKINLTLSYSFLYYFASEYDYSNSASTESEAGVQSNFSLGVGWKLTRRQSVNFTLGYGVTNDDSDFSLAMRLPFEFKLF